MLPFGKLYLPYNAVFVVYRLQRIPTFYVSGRTRTSTSIPRGIPIAIPFYGFTLVVREPDVRLSLDRP